LEVTNPGCPTSDLLGDLDIRTDLPKYRVHRGEEFEEVTDIRDRWTADSVAILLGCSFTFEVILSLEIYYAYGCDKDVFVEKGIPVRHMEEGVNVPMYVTNRSTVPSGPFRGPLVVPMRPIPSKLVSEAKEITSRFPSSHGAPVHIGDPAAIGIVDLGKPDFGDSVTVESDEVPMFWACGVTSQLAFKGIGDIEWISHAPGCMLVTDRESSYID